MRYGDFRTWAASWWAGIFGQTRLSRTGEGASTTDTVRMADGTSDSPEEAIELTRLEQYGDVVCPPADTNAIIWRKSDGGVVMSLGLPRVRPTDGKPGDRGLYSDKAGTRLHLHGAASATPGAIELLQEGGARVVIDKDGAVRIDAKSPQDVVVNGGTKSVAREGDPVGYLYVTTGPIGMGVGVVDVTWSTLELPLAPGQTKQALHITGGAPRFKG